ncbi:histidine phosphatase family protein [Herbidospora galbida]|uniref:Histidine phosphatase family protein n=1 Tax=Herbidospora galbida TaxID=2575442 RepID=A0A4V5UWZ3_9ACTN|nr:histidine phosphatase family protein [Herbidospora galbida]TKK78773.1 histidine phosphatase family protein [Herbidospora galbida]
MAHPLTASQRDGVFPVADEPADLALFDSPTGAIRLMRGPEARCDLLPGAEVVPELRDLGMGNWTGRRLADVDPRQLARWVGDPEAAPHGGESVGQLLVRVRGWLDRLDGGAVFAVTHPGVVRAAVSVATGADYQRVDVPPLGRASLTGVGGRWNLRLQ